MDLHIGITDSKGNKVILYTEVVPGIQSVIMLNNVNMTPCILFEYMYDGDLGLSQVMSRGAVHI